MPTYEFVETLEEALFGEIQLCRDIESGQTIVVKTMATHRMKAKLSCRGLAVDEDAFNEIKMARLLRAHPHPNIVQFRESVAGSTECQLVMDYCSRGELFAYNAEIHQFRMPFPLVRRFFGEIVNGVAHLHSLKIAHRDISLENILLDDDFHCRLCDFGLATRKGSWCQGSVGKLFYMAPEVYANTKYYDGRKADLWSLGVLLYIMLTGQPPPFEYTTPSREFRSIERADLVKLSLPIAAMDLLLRLLRVHPNQRISIQDVLSHPYITESPKLKKPSILSRFFPHFGHKNYKYMS